MAALFFWTALLIVIGNPRFLVNDSVSMRGFVSGQYAGSPQEHLVFSSPLLAWVLSHAYNLTVNFDWYSAALVLTMLGAASVMIMQIESRIFFLAWFSVSTVGVTYAVLHPDYTFVALVASGLIIAATLVRGVSGKAPPVRLLVLLTFALVIASSWRPAAGLLSLAILAPVIALALTRSQYPLRTTVPLVGPLLSLFIYSLQPLLAEPAWSEWLQYNSVRGSLHGTDRLGLASDWTLETPWTQDALIAFNGFFYPDEPIFGLQSVEILDQSLQGIVLLPSTSLPGLMLTAGLQLFQNWPFWVFTVVAFFVPALARQCSRRRILVLTASAVVYWALLSYLLLSVRFPPRISIPFTLTIAVALGAICTVSCQIGPTKTLDPSAPMRFLQPWLWASVLMGLLVAVLISPPVSLNVLQPAETETKSSRAREWLRDNTTSCNVYVASPLGTTLLYDSKAFSTTSEHLDLPLLTLGWPTMSPAWQERKANLGIDTPVLASLIRYSNRQYDRAPSISGCFLGTESEALTVANLLSQLAYGVFLPVKVGQNPEQPVQISVYEFREVGASDARGGA